MPGNRNGIACTDHLGNRYESRSEMARAYGLSVATLVGRLRRGLPVEQALTMAKQHGPEQPCEDHLGNRYPSQTAMFRHYGINQTVYKYRMAQGWGLEKTLTTLPGDSDLAGAHACRDHEGNEFPSIKAMCDYWRVPRNVFFTRRKSGRPLSECLDPETKTRQKQQRPVLDHTGAQHRNLDAMCAAWGIPKADYIQNIRNGLDLKRALTEKTERPKHPKDHLGREYPSINAMCRAWGITKTVLRSRLELGWTLREILENPGNNSHVLKSKDHLGNEYPSMKAMLAAWGVSYTTYTHRLSVGMTLEQALTPSSQHMLRVEDHEGHSFPCLQAMLDYWLVRVPNWHHRYKRLDLGMEKSLTLLHQGLTLPGGITVVDEYDGGRWLLVSTGSGRAVYSRQSLFTILRRERLLEEIAAGTLPEPMRAKHMGGNWFHAWGTDRFGPSPGVITDPDTAWLERCLAKYRPELATANQGVPAPPAGPPAGDAP